MQSNYLGILYEAQDQLTEETHVCEDFEEGKERALRFEHLLVLENVNIPWRRVFVFQSKSKIYASRNLIPVVNGL
jgi:aromatic ring hydroxylase